MSLDIKQLRAFAAVAECGSFTSAARKLGKAQSTVSEAISVLEIDCGIELFDRSQKCPPLTEAGLSMLREAKSVLAAYEGLCAKARGFHEGLESRLTFAYDPMALPFDFLANTLGVFQEKYPFIELEIFAVETQDVLDLVKNGRASVGVLMYQGVSLDSIDGYGIGNVQNIQVAAPDHPLASMDVATEADLHRYHKLTLTSRAHSEPLHHPSVTNHLWYLSDPETLIRLLKAGFGWSLLPDHLVKSHIRSGELAYVNVDEQKQHYKFAVDFIWNRKSPMGPAASFLREKLSGFPEQ